jgi:hypothetical protein
MCRAVCAAPGVPGVRLLQRPPGAERVGGCLIFLSARGGIPRSFIYANRGRCHGWRPRLRGGHFWR